MELNDFRESAVCPANLEFFSASAIRKNAEDFAERFTGEVFEPGADSFYFPEQGARLDAEQREPPCWKKVRCSVVRR
jgi:hypothetical protein